MSNFCGIDLSLSGTGIVVINKKHKILEKLLVSTSPNLSVEERIDIIVKKFDSIILKYNIEEANVEGLAFGLRGQRSLELAGLHYCFRVRLVTHKIPFRITPPTVLKKFVTGSGKAKKNLMLLSVYKKWKVTFKDDNLADAYSLARYLNP